MATCSCGLDNKTSERDKEREVSRSLWNLWKELKEKSKENKEQGA
jgi:hypothetical protein